MDKLTKEIYSRKHQKIKKLKRIQIGKILFVYASLPLFSAWAYLIAVPLMLPISPSVWAKGKLIDFHEWRVLK